MDIKYINQLVLDYKDLFFALGLGSRPAVQITVENFDGHRPKGILLLQAVNSSKSNEKLTTWAENLTAKIFVLDVSQINQVVEETYGRAENYVNVDGTAIIVSIACSNADETMIAMNFWTYLVSHNLPK